MLPPNCQKSRAVCEAGPIFSTPLHARPDLPERGCGMSRCRRSRFVYAPGWRPSGARGLGFSRGHGKEARSSRATDILLTQSVYRIASGWACRAKPKRERRRRLSPNPAPFLPSLCAVAPNSGIAAATATHRMDGLMERKIPPQDRPDKGAALIAILLLSLCLWPVVWELASAIRQYL